MAARSIRDTAILKTTWNNDETRDLLTTMMLMTYNQMHQKIDGTKNDIFLSQTTHYNLEAIKCPTAIIHGTNDQLAAYESNALEFQKRIQNVKLLTIPGGEHVAIFTHCAQVREYVQNFLSELN